MTTNPAGRIFISYRRSPARPTGDEEARLLRDALRDRGVPTWRDLDDLEPNPTEVELSATLSDPGIAGAVMLISPEIEDSDMVRYVEAPAILDRFAKKDGFLVKLVLIDLDYGDADRVLNRAGALQKVGRFDIDKVGATAIVEADAHRIANAVLKARLQAIHGTEETPAYTAGLFSRRTPGMTGYTLRHDFTPYFDGRSARAGAYERIEAALFDEACILAATGEKISLTARGNAALPLGVLYGAIHSPFVFDLTWKQALPGSPEENWSLSTGVGEIDLSIDDTKGAPASEDLILAVSINANVERAVGEYLATTAFNPRATISVRLADGPLKQGQTLSPEDGLAVAYAAIDKARSLKTELRMKRATLHLFLACPLSLAVLIGQKLNTFAECVVYEHFSDQTPAYAAAHRFNPSNFTYKST